MLSCAGGCILVLGAKLRRAAIAGFVTGGENCAMPIAKTQCSAVQLGIEEETKRVTVWVLS